MTRACMARSTMGLEETPWQLMAHIVPVVAFGGLISAGSLSPQAAKRLLASCYHIHHVHSLRTVSGVKILIVPYRSVILGLSFPYRSLI